MSISDPNRSFKKEKEEAKGEETGAGAKEAPTTYVLARRALMAALAEALRSSGVIFSAPAFPPLRPPKRPRCTAAGSLSFGGASGICPARYPQFSELVGVPRALGVRFQVGFLSGRLTSSNVATWVLSNHDSSVAPQTSQDA